MAKAQTVAGHSMFGPCRLLTLIVNVAESEHPHLLNATSVTVYVPLVEYECVGFTNVEVFPSPKFQKYVSALRDWLIKLTGVFLQTMPDAVKAATGELIIVTHRSSFPTQPLVSVSKTVICPDPAGPHNTVTQG